MPLERYPWHAESWQGLHRARREDRLPHALLLAGPEGLGKRAFADRLIAAWLCAAPTADGEACGACKSCGLLAAGHHPDVMRLEPEEVGKQIKVDAVRGLFDFITLTPVYHQCRVALINPAENMNLSSANSLLKMLEEPPPSGRFVLVTHQPARLLATIRSRCQRVDPGRGNHQTMLQWLQSQNPDSDGSLLLRLANHAPLRALAMSEKMPARGEFYRSLAALLTRREAPLTIADQWRAEAPGQILDWMTQATMDLIRLGAGVARLDNEDQREILTQCGRQVSPRGLFRLLDKQTESARLLAATNNVKAQGLLADLAITWHQLRGKP